MQDRMNNGLPAETRRHGFRSTCRNTLVAMSLGAAVVLMTPTTALAAAYPVTGVTQIDYAMVGPSADTQKKMALSGCIVVALFSKVVGAACAIGATWWNPTQDQSGWWREQIWQTSQAYVHLGSLCNMSRSSCTLYKWDIYVKTSTPFDVGCFAYLVRYGPMLYGYSKVYVCPKYPNNSVFKALDVIHGNGL